MSEPDATTTAPQRGATTLDKLAYWYPRRDRGPWVLGVVLEHHPKAAAGTLFLFEHHTGSPSSPTQQVFAVTQPQYWAAWTLSPCGIAMGQLLAEVVASRQGCCCSVASPGEAVSATVDLASQGEPSTLRLGLHPIDADNFYCQLKQLYFYLMAKRDVVYAISHPNGTAQDSALVFPNGAPLPFPPRASQQAHSVHQADRLWLVTPVATHPARHTAPPCGQHPHSSGSTNPPEALETGYEVQTHRQQSAL